MPRNPRKKSESGIYHIMVRGINRQNIFEDEEDKLRLLTTLERYRNEQICEVYGYCFMDNHIHLIIKETGDTISTIIKKVSGSYVYWYNNKYDRSGHLFQERYKSEVVENEGSLLRVLRYVHQNPLKAGIVQEIAGYKWSSYSEYVNKPRIVNTDYVLDRFSTNKNQSIELFKKYTKEKNNDQCLEYVPRIKISDDEIRNCFFQFGLSNMSELQQLEKNKRNEMIREVKTVRGVTIRQLARVTGISKSVIDRV